MATITTQTEIGLCIEGDQIHVFVGDDGDPSTAFSLLDLVRDEILSHGLPASARSIEDIESMSIDGLDAITNLQVVLDAALAMTKIALIKTR